LIKDKERGLKLEKLLLVAQKYKAFIQLARIDELAKIGKIKYGLRYGESNPELPCERRRC
jgi:hypothetical protein